MQESMVAVGRNQFRCYHCRLIFAQKDGNWFDWDEMQVHLCKICEKQTKKQIERSYSQAAQSASKTA